jgi:RimJ/RimL family protein N-acetyltransferase
VGFNERAIACYRRLGFVEEARLRSDIYAGGRWHDNVVMSVTRDEFHAEEEQAR